MVRESYLLDFKQGLETLVQEMEAPYTAGGEGPKARLVICARMMHSAHEDQW